MKRPNLDNPHGHQKKETTSRTGINENVVTPTDNSPLTFYPAYTFKASATWSKWVKFTCNDIHAALKSHRKYADVTSTIPKPHERGGSSGTRAVPPPLLLFYLNHPVQFVQVIGVVVALEDYFEKFWLFTVDDSSGATIDVTCWKPDKQKEKDVVNQPQSRHQSTHSADQAHNDPVEAEAQLLQTTLSQVRLGTVVQAKGTLTTFRNVRQLSLLRLTIVPSTTHEMALISSRTDFLSTTLSRPWTLSTSQQAHLRAEAQDEKEEEVQRAGKRRKREAKRQKREERHARLVREEYEAEEVERSREAEEARRAGQALKQRDKS